MRKIILLLFIIQFSVLSAQEIPLPKREFRGAWIQCVNGQFQGMGRDRMQQELIRQLDAMQRCNINAVIFQVRAEYDALYASNYEPWSRFLTGQQGTPPNPYWDPLAWMIEQCHQRGMELHAWINPYRAKTKGTRLIATNNDLAKHPDRFFNYGDLIIADPGKAENCEYICKIASDIVSRYDIDGFHIDDYFYPYPQPGLTIPDDYTYQTTAQGYQERGDWRRNNVNKFIKALHDSIKAIKPWIKIGVSPFGIYHNENGNSTIPGSQTRGLQNYDDLYADVLLWVNNGWVDYIIPQVYWEIGHKLADYATLVQWWDKMTAKRNLYIGQDLTRTAKAPDLRNPRINQLPAKMRWQRMLGNIKGSCLWYSAALANNVGNMEEAYSKIYHRLPALPPLMPYIDNEAPKKVRKVKDVWTEDGLILFWTPPKYKDIMNKAHQYVVYRFLRSEDVNLEDPNKIVAITQNTFLPLPYENGKTKYRYVVTALDRVGNESKGEDEKVKL